MNERQPRPFPVGDACRVVHERACLVDIDGALALIGLRRLDQPLPPDTIEVAEAADELAGLLETPGGGDAMHDDQSVVDEVDDDVIESEGRVGEAVPPSSELKRSSLPTVRGARQHIQRSMIQRSMVAYLLTPDKQDPSASTERAAPDYEPVRDEVQRIDTQPPQPDSETWRVARRIVDSGPRTRRPGRLDLRECANRIARGEIIRALPRREIHGYETSMDVLVDLGLRLGPFGSDVRQLETALKSMSSTSATRFGMVRRGGTWLAGPGPLWEFEPVSSMRFRSTIIVVGGLATADLVASIGALQDLVAAQGAYVAVVWIGDAAWKSLPGTRTWSAFRHLSADA